MRLRFTPLLLLLGSPLAVAVVDQNGDGMGDLWQLKFDAATLAPAADDDGDGQTNRAEAGASTNPHQPQDVFKISRLVRTAIQVEVAWLSVAGKRYQVESSPTLDGGSWTALGSPAAGTDAELTATFPTTASQQYFRVRVADVDTDGDGATDWEEIQAGTDPTMESHGHMTDMEHLLYVLQTPPYISIVATDADASEPGASSPADPGTVVVKRSGGLGAVTVYLNTSGATTAADFSGVPSAVTLGFGVASSTLTVTPLADSLTESDEALIIGVTPHASYSPGLSPSAAVLIHDQVQANGTGLWAEFFNEATNLNDTTNPPLFTNRVVTRVDPVVDYAWPDSTVQGVGSPAVGVNTNYFSSRWSGEILPEFSQTYTFELIVNRGGRLWVNGQLIINNWPGNGAGSVSGTYTGLLDLVGGKRVPIVLEQFESTATAECHLRWQAASLTKAIIPLQRMFPQTPPQFLSASERILLQHSGTQSWQLTASGNPPTFAAAALPAGWTMHPTSGMLAGPTDTAGSWLIPVTATNAYGSGSALLQLDIVATGGLATHETWTGIAVDATTVTFAWTTPPTTTATLPTAEIPAAASGPVAQRLRGYLTAPETGMYRFWISGDDSAELLVSNDSEPINLFSRASLATATVFQGWAAAAQAPILWLEAGQRYYWEARTVNQLDTGHVSVGWLLPSQGGTDPMAASTPGAVIPAYALSPWLDSTPTETVGTLYTTAMAAQGTNLTGAYGSGTLLVNEAGTQAVLQFSYANLSAPKTGNHIHSAAHGGAIIFDIDTAVPEADGSHVWTFAPVGAISVADIKAVIASGQAFLNIHTANYPAGEISGTFRQQTGSQRFTPPAAPPAWTDDHTNRAAAVRFLTQATYGATETDIQAVQALGYEGWLDQQLALSASPLYPLVYARRNVTNPGSPTYSGSMVFNAWWQQAVTAPDQLRQRMAFALSQISVISEAGVLDDKADALSDYYDMLLSGAFGNARDLLENVTLHPAMGRYLDMLGNQRPDKATGRIPNENYAREVLQLFSVGLYRLHPDGSLMLDSVGQPIPTYGQEEIIGFAHAFTGWNYNQADAGAYKPTNWSPASDWLNPLREVPDRHDIGPKRILNNVVLPGLPKLTTSGGTVVALNPTTNYASNTTVRNDDEFQNLAGQELDATHDSIFHHPNFGPFLCSQLIQRLVTSTPSRAYVYRVARVFENNGSGVRGDLRAVLKAILLDYEARSQAVTTQQGYGKQKEPVLRVTNLARAFPSPAAVTATYQQTDGFITFTTATPHRLVSGNPLTLEFTSGTPSPPTSGAYTVTSSMPITTNVFSVRGKEILSLTYSQSDTTVTATASGHGLNTGMSIYVKFPTGASANQLYPITYVNSSTFTFTVADSATRSNQAAVAVKHTGGYAMAANSTTVTLTSSTNHHLTTGENVYIDFAPVSGQTTGPGDGLYPVTVIDTTRFSIEHAATFTSSRSGTFIMSPELPVLSLSGQAATNFSTYSMGDTETDLAQTPMRSPTVFNFYAPNYQFPGTLAANGLVTPEFELTSDTNVIRQSNFIYEGILKPSSTGSVHSSFRSGNGVLGLDFTPWMVTRPNTSLPWTDTTNLPALVDELATLLTAGQLPAAARTIIVNYTGNTANIAYTTGTDAQKANRLRAIVHLIATSPDFTIQR